MVWVKMTTIFVAAVSLLLAAARHREWRGGLLLLSCVFFAAGMTTHSNVVHASVNEAETRHNLKALTGETLEQFLARTASRRSSVSVSAFLDSLASSSASAR